MKRILVLALAAILCLSLVACGEKKNEETTPNTTETNETNEVPEIIVVPEVEEEPEVVSGELSGEEVAEEPAEVELSGEIAE